MQNDGSISPVRAFFRSKWVRIILIIDVLAVIAVIGVLIWNATKTATINFNVTPIDAKIQIDGRGEYYNGSYQVHPGNHTITISHDGLETKNFELDLKSGYDTTLTAFLKGADNNFEFYELKDNYASFQKLAEIASKDNNITTDHDASAEQFIIDYQQAYQLWQAKLPIEYSELKDMEYGRILTKDVTIKADFSESCQKLLCIKALIVFTDEDFVNQLLVNNGFKLENYEIHYQIY